MCLSSRGICHTSGEAAFPRPRLGQVLTPLGVNIIALARTVIIDCVELNCHICQSVEHQLFGRVAHGLGFQQGEQVAAILVCVMLFADVLDC